jgi:hypothetical protein
LKNAVDQTASANGADQYIWGCGAGHLPCDLVHDG